MAEKQRMGLILVVDDDEGVTQTFARMLRLEGYEVLTAANAETGLQLARQRHPDAIVLDLRMPLINGLGFLYRLRNDAAHRHTPVAIVTGDFLLDDELASEIADLDAEVRFKPLWEEELVDLARHLVSRAA